MEWAERLGPAPILRYALAVSRRTPVVSSMRRSDHPSRPSPITCSRFSVLETFAILATGTRPIAAVNVSIPATSLAGFQVSIIGRFWVSTEGRRDRRQGREVPEPARCDDLPPPLHARRVVRRRAQGAARRCALARSARPLPVRPETVSHRLLEKHVRRSA